MQFRLFCAVMMFSGAAVAAEAPQCTRPAGAYDVWSSMVVDKATSLAWKRCSVGQAWNGSTCTGTATGYWFSQAVALPAPAGSDGFVWRLPNPNELATLVTQNPGCNPVIDQQAFPQTMPSYYWTSQALNAPGIDNAYCQYFAAGGSPVNNCYAGNGFYVRFVSSVPPGYKGPPQPWAGWFNIDETGQYLLVGGSNFNANPVDNTVNFVGESGVISVIPVEATTISLKVAIPDGATTGKITVTSNSVTSAPSSATLRVINNNAGCTAAGFTSAIVPGSLWQYCILKSPTATPFSDKAADVMVIGARASVLPKGQQYYFVSTSNVNKSLATTVALNSRIATQFDATANVYGAVIVNKTSKGLGPDTVTSNTGFFNNGVIFNRGNFNNYGSMKNVANGLVQNTGTFTNKPASGGGFALGTKGSAIASLLGISPVSFINASESSSGLRATLNNMGQMATLDGAVAGIQNAGGDVVNTGVITLQSFYALVNKSQALQASAVTNTGTIRIPINPSYQKPVVENEADSTISNRSGATISNSVASWAILNNGTISNCGTVSGAAPGPNGYAPCQ